MFTKLLSASRKKRSISKKFMSYITNTTANRFNINKGWINSHLPENLSFYARDNVMYLKIFLFFKAYFTLRNIKLISCQIRLGQDQVPMLYLVINHTTRRKKKRSKSTFMHLWPIQRAGFKDSPLRNPWNTEALNLMFFELERLKKIFHAQLLPLSKQKPSRFWLTKPRKSTWLNFLTKAKQSRRQSLRSRNLQNFNPNRVKVFKYPFQNALTSKFSRALKEFLLLTKILKSLKPDQKRTVILQYQKRLQKISRSIQTMNSIFSQIPQRQKVLKKKLQRYQKHRTSQLITRFQWTQLKLFHQILQKNGRHVYASKLQSFEKNPNFIRLWRSKKLQKSKFWNLWKNKKAFAMTGLTRNQTNLKKLILQLLTIRFKLDQSTLFNLIHMRFDKRIRNSRSTLKRSSSSKVISIRKKALSMKVIKHLINKKQRWTSKKKVMPVLLHQVQRLRSNQKVQLNFLDRNLVDSEILRKFRSAKLAKKTSSSIIRKINRTRTYRQSFRKSYKRHLNVLVRYQYKLWIQKVLQTFFQTRFEVKFTQPLTQFKNLKFLRLVYPIPHFRQLQKISLTSFKHNLYSTPTKFLGKRYVYLGTGLKRFQRWKKSLRLSLRSQNKNIKFHRNSYTFQKKADLFKRGRQKKLRDYAQKRLGSIKNQLLMREFVPTLSLFIKYLNPQILADHIAKEFEKTKKHRNIIFALKTALRSLKFARGIGYRIAIVGRINSSTKSRAFYLTKKSLIRQNFSQKINYATAQAKARIGAFGIKVWLFY